MRNEETPVNRGVASDSRNPALKRIVLPLVLTVDVEKRLTLLESLGLRIHNFVKEDVKVERGINAAG